MFRRVCQENACIAHILTSWTSNYAPSFCIEPQIPQIYSSECESITETWDKAYSDNGSNSTSIDTDDDVIYTSTESVDADESTVSKRICYYRE